MAKEKMGWCHMTCHCVLFVCMILNKCVCGVAYYIMPLSTHSCNAAVSRCDSPSNIFEDLQLVPNEIQLMSINSYCQITILKRNSSLGGCNPSTPCKLTKLKVKTAN
eukprot:530092_1